MIFANLETKSRHHFPAALLEKFEDEFPYEGHGSKDFFEGNPVRVAFFIWDKNSPHNYAVVFYKDGNQFAVKNYNIFDTPLEITYEKVVA